MAEKKSSDWNDTCNRFVAFLDIMGFKDRLQRDGHEKVGEMLESLLPTIEFIKNYPKIEEKLQNNRSSDKNNNQSPPIPVIPVIFSDSIILISIGVSIDSAAYFVAYVGFLLSNAFRQGIPMKGAIAYGKMTADSNRSLYFGQPLIDAVELQKELQLYGVVLHHTMEKYINIPNNIYSFESALFKYAVPMKSGSINHYILSWSDRLINETNIQDLSSRLYNNVSGKPRIYVDNTMEFLRWLKKEKAKLSKKKKS